MAAKNSKAPEFRVPGRDAKTVEVARGGLRAAHADRSVASRSGCPVLVALPLADKRADEDFDSRRIDVRVSVKAARGLKRLRLGLDGAGAMRSNGRRLDPNSVRDTIECLLEMIADAETLSFPDQEQAADPAAAAEIGGGK